MRAGLRRGVAPRGGLVRGYHRDEHRGGCSRLCAAHGWLEISRERLSLKYFLSIKVGRFLRGQKAAQAHYRPPSPKDRTANHAPPHLCPTPSFSVSTLAAHTTNSQFHPRVEKPNFATSIRPHHQHNQHSRHRCSSRWLLESMLPCFFLMSRESIIHDDTSKLPTARTKHRSLTASQEQEIVQGQEGPQEEDAGPLCPQRLVRHQGMSATWVLRGVRGRLD